jgi:hypothetical protein
MGGTNDPENIQLLTVEEHAEAHRKLYEKHGKFEDYLAWKGLIGQISKQDILKEIYRKNGKNWSKNNIGKTSWNKGLTKENDDRVKKYSKTLKGRDFSEQHKNALKKSKSTTENMGKYERTEETKNKLRKAAQKQFNEEARKKHSDIMKRRRQCVYCGMESNLSNVTRHEKVCSQRP